MEFCFKTVHNRNERKEIYFFIVKKLSWYRMLAVIILSYSLLIYMLPSYQESPITIILYSIYCMYWPFHFFVSRWLWIRQEEKSGKIPYCTEISFYDTYFECKYLNSNRVDVRPYKMVERLNQTKNYYILSTKATAYVISKESVPEEQRDSFRDFLATIVSQ